MPADELQKLIQQDQGQHSMAWLLYFGMSGDKMINQLIPYIYPGTQPQNYEEKACEVLKDLYRSVSNKEHDRMYLVHALSESQQWSLADQLTPTIVDWASMWHVLCRLPADHSAVAQFLSHVTQPIDLLSVRGDVGSSGLQTMLTGPSEHGYKGLHVDGNVPRDLLCVLSDLIASHTGLQYLRLGGGMYQTIDQSLPFVSASNATLNHLSLTGDNITPDWLMDNTGHLVRLEALTLSTCKFTDRGQWRHVLHELQHLLHLRYLTLRYCGLDDEMVQAVAQIVITLPLTWLDLSGNDGIHDEGIQCLGCCLQNEACRLTALYVQCCCYTSEGQGQLCAGLLTYPQMKILGIDAVGLDHVSLMMQTNSGIEELYLWNKHAVSGSDGAGPDSTLALQDNRTLTYLDCSGYSLSDDILKALTSALQNNFTLHCLSLKPPYFVDTFKLSGSILAKFIDHTHLQALDLSHVEVDDAGCQHVATAVCQSKTLETVGMNNMRVFLQVLTDHYPCDGPLRALYCRRWPTEEVTSLIQRLKDRLTPSFLHVYYDVWDMPVHGGYRWCSILPHTQIRLNCDINMP